MFSVNFIYKEKDFFIMKKPTNKKIKTAKLNVKDNISESLDNLKSNVNNTTTPDVNSELEKMKNILSKQEDTTSEKEIITNTETCECVNCLDSCECECHSVIISEEIETIEETVMTEEVDISEEIEMIEEIEEIVMAKEIEETVISEETVVSEEIEMIEEIEEIVMAEETVTQAVSVPTYEYTLIYSEFISNYQHSYYKIRENETIKLIIDGHYHNHLKIKDWTKSPFNLYIENEPIFLFRNEKETTDPVEHIILFRGDHVFVNGVSYKDDMLTVSHTYTK
jgi:hypothetical protein